MTERGADAEALMRRYAAALHEAVADPGEQSLSAAYELGRDAVRSGLSVLDLAAAHNEGAAAELGAAPDPAAAQRAAQATGAFFLESLSAYEMLQRVLREGQERAMLQQRQTTLLRRPGGLPRGRPSSATRPSRTAPTRRSMKSSASSPSMRSTSWTLRRAVRPSGPPAPAR